MKPSGRPLHRRQGVRRSERDLVSVLIAEGSLSSDWLVKCGDDRSVVSNLPQAQELPHDPGVSAYGAHGLNDDAQLEAEAASHEHATRGAGDG